MGKRNNETIIVTGTSSGIGNATAKELARQGYHILAGVRTDEDADSVRGNNIEPIILDITKESHIEALVARINKDPKKRSVKALVNNAAIEINAPIEVLALSEWRRQLEVNVVGQVAMIQALLPNLIASKGMIMNISSIGGKVALGGYGPYAATKFALEGLSDSLRRELAPLGVKVVVIQPGAVISEMSKQVRANAIRVTNGMTNEQKGRYKDLMNAMVSQAESYIDKALSAKEAGTVITKIIGKKNPRARYAVGSDAKMLSAVIRFLPDRMIDRLIARSLKPHLKSQIV